MVIAELRVESEIKNVLFNTVQDLLVTLANIKIKAENDVFYSWKEKTGSVEFKWKK